MAITCCLNLTQCSELSEICNCDYEINSGTWVNVTLDCVTTCEEIVEQVIKLNDCDTCCYFVEGYDETGENCER